MESTGNLIEPLLEGAGAYSKTSIELLKLKALDKTADIGSTLISRLLLAGILSFFVIALNIAAALWLGELCGKNYYGFLLVALFYGILAIVLYFIQPMIKGRLNDSLVKQMFN
jgi:hypothetical protein